MVGGAVLYHVAEDHHPVGHLVATGRWGQLARQFRPGGPPMPPEVLDGILWELSLEASRRGYDPSLPSRLDCVFACESLQDALTFRDKHRPSGHVYPVEIADAGTKVFRGDYDLISHCPKWGGYTDYLPVNALRYWSEPPVGMVELLISGAVRIIGPALAAPSPSKA